MTPPEHPLRRATDRDNALRRAWRRGWPVIVSAAVCLVVATLFYVAYTVHAHNGGIDCLKADVNQLINELNAHHHLTTPPNCK